MLSLSPDKWSHSWVFLQLVLRRDREGSKCMPTVKEKGTEMPGTRKRE